MPYTKADQWPRRGGYSEGLSLFRTDIDGGGGVPFLVPRNRRVIFSPHAWVVYFRRIVLRLFSQRSLISFVAPHS